MCDIFLIKAMISSLSVASVGYQAPFSICIISASSTVILFLGSASSDDGFSGGTVGKFPRGVGVNLKCLLRAAPKILVLIELTTNADASG